MIKSRLVFLAAGALLWFNAFGKVTADINSGNPSFPFPQFQDYGPGKKTLASVNAPGVTHAEMEQRARDAWQMVCNNTAEYPGAKVGGVQYLYPDPLAPTTHCTCVEGDGYYLLGAAIMADKTFFDGYYMWAHDRGFQGVKRYIDGIENSPDYNYSKGLSGAGKFGASTDVYGGSAKKGINSATDGDEDVAMALLLAYKQWGEHSGVFIPAMGGKELNYKEEALRYIRAMVDTVLYPDALPEKKYVTGVIGLDGYLKNGDSWSELTSWAINGYKGIPNQNGGNTMVFFDYNCPAWLHEFRLLLEGENDSPFYISQLKRGEASGDWLIGNMYSQDPKNIPVCGHVTATADPSDFHFAAIGPFSEDMRAGWRTILNYVWHGNPTYTWDPVTHEVVEGKSNTYQYDMGVRFAKFLKNPQGAPWNNSCNSIGDLASKGLTFKGPYTVRDKMDMQGTIGNGFPLNWIHGSGSPSAIAGQDFELMGEMFRHCATVWDGDGYIDSQPLYFHEWFKLLGLLVLSGNYHAPKDMIPTANLKVYNKLDKTFAYTNDTLTYTVSYRNYGSLDAKNSIVKFGIPTGFEFISSDKGVLSGDSIVWNIGTITGFKTGGLAATQGSFKVILKVGPTASGNYCTTARIACSNGTGWISNEYPNNQTATMERNCVDIVKRALRINKVADRKEYNPGQDIKYKIVFENSSDAGWINGGRTGVNLSFAHGEFNGVELKDPANASGENILKFRLFNDAAEPYINYGNYRVSYFMFDPNIKCYSGNTGCTNGWGVTPYFKEGVDPNLVKISHETIVPGENADGKWNQRIMIQFSDQLATITQHLQQYTGSPRMVHEGGMAVLRAAWNINAPNYAKVDWTDDWSWEPTLGDESGGLFYPISEDYTDLNNLGTPVNSWHRKSCISSSKITKKILIEEWDGYVWRRVFGNGPSPGRDIDNVIVSDTLPAGVTFKNFIKETALGIKATTKIVNGRTVILWTIPKMQVNMKDSILFTAVIGGACPMADQELTSKAWIKGQTESPAFDEDTVLVTCKPVAICPEPTTITKTSDKAVYSTGETVKYTIDYTQTQGSIANPDLSLSQDWTAQNGPITNATFADGKISAIGADDLILTHDYSYGTNTVGEGIEGTIQISGYTNSAIALRHTGGGIKNGIYAVIRPANPSIITIYDGTTLLHTYTLPVNQPVSFDFKIKLTGNKLEMWIDATPASFSGAAAIIVTGLPVRAGWCGIARGAAISPGETYGSTVLTSWKTHLDAAFDVSITDPVPAGITSPVAISGTGTNTAGVITWNVVSGKTPLLYNTKKTFSWDGTLSDCKKTTNIAYVNTRGLDHNLYGICYAIECSDKTCTAPTSVDLKWSDDLNLCAGESVTLTALQVGGGGTSYKYQLLESGKPVGTANATGVFTIKTAGKYSVSAIDNDDANCSKTSAVETVVMNPSPTYTVSGGGTVCKGVALPDIQLDFTGTGPWNISIDGAAPVSITANPYIISPTTAQTYTFNTFSDANCPELANIDQTADVIETPLPVASVTSTDHEYCGSVSDVTIKLSAPATADFAWSDGTASVNSNSSAFPNAPAGTYSVTVTDKLCKTVLTDITVSSVAQPTYTISGGGTVCKGQALPAVTIDFVGTGPWNFTLNNGSTTTALSTATSKYAVANVVAGTYTLDNVTDANCAGVAVATEKADVVVNPLPVISFVGLPAGICQNAAPLAISVSETTGTNTVTWAGGSGMSFDPTKQAPGNVTLKYIHTSAATSCTDSITKDIAIYAKPVASTAPQDTTICEGSNEPISGVATGGSGTYTKHQWIETTGSYLSSTSAQQVTFKGTAPIASYPLQYIVTDGNSCSDTANVTITVTGKNNSLAFPALASVCEKSVPVILNTATPTGGIYSGTGVSGNLTDGYVFDPSDPAITGGKDYTLTYTYAPGSNCEVSVVSKITVKPGITLSFGSIKREYCSYDAVENLIGFTPATSVLSGTGITGTTFNPATAAIVKDKPFNIYLQNNDNGCTTRDSISLTVYAPPTVSFPAPAASFCSNDAAIDLGITPWDANASLVSVPSGLVSGKIFSPSLAATYGQSIDLNYTYTSASTSCTTSVSHSTIVYKTDKPVTKDEVCVVNTTVPNLTATGTDLKWYSDAALSNLVYSGASYNTGKTAQNVYTYYVTQTLNGCTSEAEQVKLTITDCMTPQVLVSDDKICAGEASKTLTATTTSPLDADQSYRWYDETHTIVSTSATHTPTLVTGKSSYKFSVLIYDAGSACEGASSDVFFTVNALPTVSFNLPASVCQGAANIALVGSHVGGTFTGTGVTGNAVSGYSFSPSANGISGSIALTYKAMDQTTGCENSIVKNITVTEAPSQIVFAPTTNVCESNTVTLAVAQTDADEIRWFDDYNSQVKTGNSFSTNQLLAGQYQYTAQAYKNSCKGISQTVNFSILDNPSATTPNYSVQVCNSQLDTAKIIAEIDGDSWTWTLVESGETIGQNETTLQYRDFITTPGNYTVVLDVSKTNGCTASYTLPIDYSQLAAPKISGPDRLCVSSQNVTYQIEGLVQSDSYLWHLANDADYQNTSAGTSYSVNLNKVGAETVIVEQVSASNGCTAQGTLPIYVAAYPQADFTYSKTAEEGVLRFTNQTYQQGMEIGNVKTPIGYESWWHFGREGEAEVRRDGKEPFTENYVYGIYTVSLRTVNDFGCEDSFVVDSISVTYATGLYVPSALSPTSRGEQVSHFKPIGKGLKTYEIWIYDQWGNLVWYSNKLVNGVPAEGWDGTANGGYLPADVYTYRIEATFLNGEKWEGMPAKTMFGEKSKFGSIMLLR